MQDVNHENYVNYSLKRATNEANATDTSSAFPASGKAFSICLAGMVGSTFTWENRWREAVAIAATVVGPQDLERWLGTLHETVLEAHLERG